MSTLQQRISNRGFPVHAGLLPPEGRMFFDISTIVLLCVGVFVVLTFKDYGIIWDAEVQNNYGKMLLKYYMSGFTDRSAFSYQNLYLYGGSFDLVAAIVNRWISPFGEYATRSLLGGLVGLLAIFGTWRLTRLIAGERAGFIATLLLALNPVFYGHMFINPKDVPFACGMVWTLYYSVRCIGLLPRIPVGLAIRLGFVLGVTLGTRIGGVLAGCYLVAGLIAWLALFAYREGPAAALKAGGRIALSLLPALPVMYLTMIALWPWAGQSLGNPITALQTFAHFPWDGEVLLNGRLVPSLDLPWFYLPLLLVVQSPEMLLAGLVCAVVVLTVTAVRRFPALMPPTRFVQWGTVALAATFPIAFFIIDRPVAYNGYRHFLFVVPPLTILAGIGFDRVWQNVAGFPERWRRLLTLAFAGAVGFQVWSMARLHPDEYIFFNQLVGGVQGAEPRYELDYWGTSLGEAALRLEDYVEDETHGVLPREPYKLMVCGHPLSVMNFLPHKHFVLTNDPMQVDFFVAWTQSGCDDAIQGKQIIRVQRGGAVLSVVKDMRGQKPFSERLD
ncbi:MAG: hypothetical protein P4M00_08770 [Azospirillaceae bacterium]|nr:hypothetical protein [Azospirillaceae bacterium]